MVKGCVAPPKCLINVGIQIESFVGIHLTYHPSHRHEWTVTGNGYVTATQTD